MGAQRWLAVAVALALVGASCGDDDDGGGDPVLPAVDQIAPAIEAVEAQLGGPQQYFEVNATGATVNLFVADVAASQVTAFSYLAGELLPPDSPQQASGATFSADAVTFDPATIFDRLLEELDGPIVTRFVIVGGPDGAVQYAATVQSEQGGTLDVLLGPDGTVQAVDPGTTDGTTDGTGGG